MRKPVDDDGTGFQSNIIQNMIILKDNVVYRDFMITNGVSWTSCEGIVSLMNVLWNMVFYGHFGGGRAKVVVVYIDIFVERERWLFIGIFL